MHSTMLSLCYNGSKTLNNYNMLRRIVRKKSLKACLVGSGPAGFYSAQKLLKENNEVTVDIIDKLPVPFGLVRFGVAPDHPEVKNVINSFTHTAKTYSDRFRFLGNIEVGKDVQVSDLFNMYNIIVLSYGAESDRKLGIPGEDSKGVFPARDFVGWYNGLPEFRDLNPDLDHDSAVIIGQGNVALDIARILLMPIDVLAKTDICSHALEVISNSKVKNVHIAGRRGPLQVSFTIPEFRELTKMSGVQIRVPVDHMSGIDTKALPRSRKRLTELMIKMSQQTPVPSSSSKSWHLSFLKSPVEILNENNRVTGVKFFNNRLEGTDIDTQKAISTGEYSEIPCGLVFRSIGYKTIPIAEESVVPFDAKSHVIPNERGRIIGKPGLYCSGWTKRGPIGVIATTMLDAMDTSESILEDIANGNINNITKIEEDIITFIERTNGKQVVSFSDWEKIDAEEIARGNPKQKPREKIVKVDEMLDVCQR